MISLVGRFDATTICLNADGWVCEFAFSLGCQILPVITYARKLLIFHVAPDCPVCGCVCDCDNVNKVAVEFFVVYPYVLHGYFCGIVIVYVSGCCLQKGETQRERLQLEQSGRLYQTLPG